ncbi:phage antirepressor N-terminal domain-containing protein [Photorhabdus cinerea]|uniref:phage antirepressor N-terminal domain-containing protein n=1 Tax=Photorhabdus cinerea TaxID=471575 RepID=UPI001A985B5E|nr:phage antirepressor N-terminal domain-containing protein [Photorhabdus cinerea]
MSIITINAIDNTINVPFHGQQIITAMVAGIAYVAMKPIVENIGLSWASQTVKLNKQKEKFGCFDIEIPSKGGIQKMLCLPLKKLNGWLFSINPEKVRSDIRDKLVQYQEECFTVLYEYWTKGEVTKKTKTTTDERTPLRKAVSFLVGRKKMIYKEAYELVHHRFNVNHIDELPIEQLPAAVEYVHKLALEGEYLGKETSPSLNGIQFPENGKILITMRNSTVDSCEIVRPDSHVLTLNTFMELAQKAGYLIIHRENFMNMENSWKY